MSFTNITTLFTVLVQITPKCISLLFDSFISKNINKFLKIKMVMLVSSKPSDSISHNVSDFRNAVFIKYCYVINSINIVCFFAL